MAIGVMVFPNSRSDFEVVRYGTGCPNTLARGGQSGPVPNAPYATNPIPDSRFPIPDSRFPIPDSRFPIPDSLRYNLPVSTRIGLTVNQDP
ncbi:MAG: hypothetical protein F6J90_27540 [Moorea sp. SIOASIH]|uniref:hypothetical protein n=1 Tax=Moorena sp. SIOASIH TaxID=2607817 RepID=UPI0013B7105D|nr:hypothetical protein [Moorena sp. SIOASIH]NEO39883.1 hypothetical protein [Moorena sp. SIOASIH]